MQRLVAIGAAALGLMVGYLMANRVSPGASHILFVPAVLVVGVVLGFALGGRAASDAAAGQDRAARLKAARQAARQAAENPSNHS